MKVVVKRKDQNDIVRLGLCTVALFTLSKWTYIFLNDYYLYDIIMTVFESTIIFTLLYVFNYGMDTMKRGQSRIFTNILPIKILCKFFNKI